MASISRSWHGLPASPKRGGRGGRRAPAPRTSRARGPGSVPRLRGGCLVRDVRPGQGVAGRDHVGRGVRTVHVHGGQPLQRNGEGDRDSGQVLGVLSGSRLPGCDVDSGDHPARRVVRAEQPQGVQRRGRHRGVLGVLLLGVVAELLDQRGGHRVSRERRGAEAPCLAGRGAATRGSGAGRRAHGWAWARTQLSPGPGLVLLRPRGARMVFSVVVSTSSASASVMHCPITSMSGIASRSAVRP